ncbi:hypothetical protein QYE76_062882 [Lolium multiflorum]|uniref:CCHC-type domain-containing protein n=1 Tax=Lolium multiflorum TaxID=4521 RepID=A0AAD8W8T8_LOLMU|nr:hypothetical protein QYE76_062882 [Lolium multiflorum]
MRPEVLSPTSGCGGFGCSPGRDPPGGSGRQPDAAHITCYNCGKRGHVQAARVDEAFCVNCKKVGHLSAMCAAVSKARPFRAVEDEFKDLVDENWKAGSPLGTTNFAVVLSKESLRIAIRGGGLTRPAPSSRPSSRFHGRPAAAESLEEVRVKLRVCPPFRHADRLLLSTRELGRPIGVDVASLAHPDALVRMSFIGKTTGSRLHHPLRQYARIPYSSA